MNNAQLAKQLIKEKKYKTLDEYITIAEKLSITLSIEDLHEIERLLKAEGEKCNAKN